MTLKALPALVRLCKVQSNLTLNTQAANTLGKRGRGGGREGGREGRRKEEGREENRKGGR